MESAAQSSLVLLPQSFQSWPFTPGNPVLVSDLMASSLPASGDSPGLIDSPRIRQGGRDVLSLALMDARNHTLHLLTQL